MSAESRARAWKTRRKKYGPSGHSGYSFKPYRPPALYFLPWNERLRLMEQFIVRLYKEGTISEGQACKACGIDRIYLRALADELAALPPSK